MSNKKIVAVVGVVVLLLVGAGVAWLKAAPAAVATPTVGATAATPSYIVVKTPTAVLFTARIDDPTVIATGVNLLKTDASGKTPKVVGVMKDDGTSGDAVKGDKVFTLRVSVNEPVVGSTYYRVSVPFKGVLQRALTPLMIVTIWNATPTAIGRISFPPQWTLEPFETRGNQTLLISDPALAEYSNNGISVSTDTLTSVPDVITTLQVGTLQRQYFVDTVNGRWTILIYEHSLILGRFRGHLKGAENAPRSPDGPTTPGQLPP